MSDSEFWEAVLARDRRHDGIFVYAVRSTGIYCRPSCPARRPQREQVQFFARPAQAEQAGFRACRRCHPNGDAPADPLLDVVEQVCRVLAEPCDKPPTLDELARQFHVSPAHLQRAFKRIVGVSPRQYADEQRLGRFKQQLKAGEPVTHALYESGYGSSSTVYEQAVTQLGMTPTAYKSGGMDARIVYSVAPCALGHLLVAMTERGVCAVRLGDSEAALEATLRDEFPAAVIARDDEQLRSTMAMLLDYLRGEQPHLDLPLDIRATAFQRRVWEALRAIPYGSTRSYREVAEAIGQPKAVRAVAHACAANPVALVVPCHRVVGSDGSLHGYRWGVERKRALLEQEARVTAGGG
jgi:AraC family transcriptional regulator of adaptative response/methylated-DNA-[protein]-cysteine methyltransferase